ncbi:hypothetical protein ACPER7_14880 [Acinetobacter dispersus]|uniref:hypothetical protein n=1 Tax=Acinetobacter dispersus TaxID=70348 RepID=UPI003C2AF5F6
MDVIENIIYGIISSLIASIIFESLRSNTNWFPGPPELTERAEQKLPNDVRAKNRAKLSITFINIYFYFSTFFIVYAALLTPPMFKKLFNENVVYLSDARFIGHLLPDVVISSSYVQIYFIFIAILIYLPLLFVVIKISYPIALLIDKFKVVTIYQLRGIQGVIFTFFSACLAILSIYLFNEITFKDAFLTLAIFVVFGVGLTSGRMR